jgi:hypothetical protein
MIIFVLNADITQFWRAKMNAKYIVFRLNYKLEESIFIFPPTLQHKDVFNAHFRDHGVVSAGFVVIRNNELFCFGESLSLEVKARPEEDGLLANQAFGGF